jgi:hypothetical protein
MAVPEIELRVAALEAEVAHLKHQLEAVAKPARPWWQEIYGTFANDPLYEEAMRLGREYRESLRPKPAKRSAAKSTKAPAKSAVKRTAKRTAKRSAKQRKR